ncbi:2-dehydro-3-deoxyphosphooctonate aldolase [Lewinella lacunae]|uniref:2-dehydro-3-deoxyphosphooctonate aldolase n=1 Tax=Neolewinella lacunae TaxID=1517758 RepID=A0A923PHX1_9BACT|nr:2-dehydro-3-deoxyphosphooctonate aldolase [Neolewinella lacunae]
MIDGNRFIITEVSTDPTYGSEANPVRVGGRSPSNERRFLEALYGPEGQELQYVRQGSCCFFKTKNGLLNDGALLDIYEVTWEGAPEPILIYIDMYDYAPLKAPKGFSLKKSSKL